MICVSDACQINDFDHIIVFQHAPRKFQMPVRSMTLTTGLEIPAPHHVFQMPVRSMTLTTAPGNAVALSKFQMPVRSMTLTTCGLII